MLGYNTKQQSLIRSIKKKKGTSTLMEETIKHSDSNNSETAEKKKRGEKSLLK